MQTITFVYNCTAHETTRFDPFYLMFGRVPRLPVDLMFQSVLCDESICDYNDYVQSLVRDLQSAMVLAQKNSSVYRLIESTVHLETLLGMESGSPVIQSVMGTFCMGKLSLHGRGGCSVWTNHKSGTRHTIICYT